MYKHTNKTKYEIFMLVTFRQAKIIWKIKLQFLALLVIYFEYYEFNTMNYVIWLKCGVDHCCAASTWLGKSHSVNHHVLWDNSNGYKATV